VEGAASPSDNGWKPESAAFEIVGRRDGQWVVRISEGSRPNDVLRYFIDQGKGVTAFEEILPSLNDIFIRLVEGTPLARQFQPVKSSI
jgi:ABC-2 type transport system ATP-binding protein